VSSPRAANASAAADQSWTAIRPITVREAKADGGWSLMTIVKASDAAESRTSSP